MKTFGIALSSGGAKGYVHIGVLKFLEEKKLIPKYISGSSIGGLVGAAFSLGYSAAKMESIARNLDKKKLFDYTIPLDSVIKAKNIDEFLESLLEDKTFEDCRCNLIVTKTNISNQRIEYTDSGLLFDAVRASIRIPGFFPPFRVNSQEFVDGGVLDPIPILPIKDKVDVVLAVKFYNNYETEVKNRFPNIVKTVLKTISTTESYIREEKLKQNPPDILLDIKETSEKSIFDYNHITEMIDLGYNYMKNNFEKLVSLLEED